MREEFEGGIWGTILASNNITLKEIQGIKTQRATEIKKTMCFILKEISRLENQKICEVLKINKSALSRYIIEVKKLINENKLKVGDLIESYCK